MLVLLFLSVLVCSIKRTASYPFSTITYNVLNISTDPNLLKYHHTRYTAGCFKTTQNGYEYNKVVPFIQHFDLVVTGCGINWNNPFTYSNHGTCVYILNNRTATAHTIERIHVHPDKQHVDYFFQNMLLYFEKQWEEKKKGIILATGGGDAGPSHQQARTILKSGSVLRWIVEQSRLVELVDNPRVLLMPVGICIREAVGDRGKALNEVLSESGRELEQVPHNQSAGHRLSYVPRQEADYHLGDYIIPGTLLRCQNLLLVAVV